MNHVTVALNYSETHLSCRFSCWALAKLKHQKQTCLLLQFPPTFLSAEIFADSDFALAVTQPMESDSQSARHPAPATRSCKGYQQPISLRYYPYRSYDLLVRVRVAEKPCSTSTSSSSSTIVRKNGGRGAKIEYENEYEYDATQIPVPYS
eukprot:scaffold10024_cov30-Prasinocladus_malaysianus.AAC.2